MVFVPNHVGMPTFRPCAKMTYLEKQIRTSRDLTPSWMIDTIFGGLNYQIEHHIFPHMSRKHLKECKALVKEFCDKAKIRYEETGFFACYKSIFKYLHAVGKETRHAI